MAVPDGRSPGAADARHVSSVLATLRVRGHGQEAHDRVRIERSVHARSVRWAR